MGHSNVSLSDAFKSLKGTPQVKATRTKFTGCNVSQILAEGVATMRMSFKYRDKQTVFNFCCC